MDELEGSGAKLPGDLVGVDSDKQSMLAVFLDETKTQVSIVGLKLVDFDIRKVEQIPVKCNRSHLVECREFIRTEIAHG